MNDVAGFALRIELSKSIIKIRLDKNEDSFLNDSEVVGREFNVVKKVSKLISSINQQVISVLPIYCGCGTSWKDNFSKSIV